MLDIRNHSGTAVVKSHYLPSPYSIQVLIQLHSTFETINPYGFINFPYGPVIRSR